MGRVVEPPAGRKGAACCAQVYFGRPGSCGLPGRKGAACCAPTARWNIHRVPIVGCGDEGTASVPFPVTIIVKTPAAKC